MDNEEEPLGRVVVQGRLNDRQARFVAEYLVDLNATQAAIRAGYSSNDADVTGPRLLGVVGVAKAIAEGKEKLMRRIDISQDRVLREVEMLAFSDVTNYQCDERGNVTLAPGAPPGAMRAIASIKRRFTTIGQGDEPPIVQCEVEIKLWDKPGIIKLAGRHVGLFPSRDMDAIKAAAKERVDELIAEAKRKRTAAVAPVLESRKGVIDVGTDE